MTETALRRFRRTIATGAAWSVPALAASGAAPAIAASPSSYCPTITPRACWNNPVSDTVNCNSGGIGSR